MGIAVERVEMSKNPVQTGETFLISVTIVTQGFLGRSFHLQLADFSHGQLKSRGTDGKE